MARKPPVDSTPDLVRTVASPVKLKPIPVKVTGQKYPVLGNGLIKSLYSSAALVGPVASGKTTCVFNILDQCCGPETVVIIFSSTIHSDDGWIAIIEWLNQNNIAHVAYTSIFTQGPQGKRNLVQEFMDGCIAQGAIDLAKRENEGKVIHMPGKPLGGGWHEKPDTKEFLPTLDPYLVKVDKVKYQYAPFVLVFDDLAEDLRAPAIALLIRKYRHFHAKVVISSQHFVDAQPGARQNIRDWFLFRGLDYHKLNTIFGATGSNVSFEKFQRRYKDATLEEHGFLHVDVASRSMQAGVEKEYIALPEK